jgi:hypothetical protein
VAALAAQTGESSLQAKQSGVVRPQKDDENGMATLYSNLCGMKLVCIAKQRLQSTARYCLWLW